MDEEVSEATVSLFADDTRIKRNIEAEEDTEKLQHELNKLYDWQKRSNMNFNDDKFEVIKYGNNRNLKEDTLYFTPEYANIIERKETVRDLGVMLDEDLTFKSHLDKIHKTVTMKIGWTLRSFHSRDSTIMKTIWKSLIQPYLDYGSPLWFSPNNQGEINQLEKLQRKFTKKIKGKEKMNYWERIKSLKMLSLQRRLERYNILYTWKVIEGIVPNCGINEYESERRGRLCCIRPINKKSTQRTKSIRENSFQISGPKLFNCLPAFIRCMSGCSVDEFKLALDKFLEHIPDEPKCEDLTPRSTCIYTSKPSNSILDQIRNIDI